MSQLPLALRFPRPQRFEHFHAGRANAATLALLRTTTAAAAPWVLLHGPAGSGKTHLLLAACQSAAEAGRRVRYAALGALPAPRAEAIAALAGAELIAIDELDVGAGIRDDEQALFDLYNRGRAEGATLLIAARQPPADLPLVLPDLRSRLGACTRAALRPLDDDERRAVLRERAAARGIELDDGVLDWLFARHARDLGTLTLLLDRIDRAALAARRRVTVPFLRELLAGTGAER
ncbi:MAG: DnaA regulatory inactivator Hda [Xanthomonadaceae bacterium]|nr:DnaA regulatory inactivator Hda [Xanthomonadaceae bacterium]